MIFGQILWSRVKRTEGNKNQKNPKHNSDMNRKLNTNWFLSNPWFYFSSRSLPGDELITWKKENRFHLHLKLEWVSWLRSHHFGASNTQLQECVIYHLTIRCPPFRVLVSSSCRLRERFLTAVTSGCSLGMNIQSHMFKIHLQSLYTSIKLPWDRVHC